MIKNVSICTLNTIKILLVNPDDHFDKQNLSESLLQPSSLKQFFGQQSPLRVGVKISVAQSKETGLHQVIFLQIHRNKLFLALLVQSELLGDLVGIFHRRNLVKSSHLVVICLLQSTPHFFVCLISRISLLIKFAYERSHVLQVGQWLPCILLLGVPAPSHSVLYFTVDESPIDYFLHFIEFRISSFSYFLGFPEFIELVNQVTDRSEVFCGLPGILTWLEASPSDTVVGFPPGSARLFIHYFLHLVILYVRALMLLLLIILFYLLHLLVPVQCCLSWNACQNLMISLYFLRFACMRR